MVEYVPWKVPKSEVELQMEALWKSISENVGK
jgi:hypothetical protein